jgi:hypothetical protein
MITPFSLLVNLNKPALQTRLGIKYQPKKFIDVETEKFPILARLYPLQKYIILYSYEVTPNLLGSSRPVLLPIQKSAKNGVSLNTKSCTG